VSVGSVVRIPLGGRKVRGYVTDVREGSQAGLKAIRGLSGDVPVFDERLLETLRWAAHHYVSPLAGILTKTAPPNLPRRVVAPSWPEMSPFASGPLSSLALAAGAGRRHPATYFLSSTDWSHHVETVVGPVAQAGLSSMVVVATAAEAGGIAADLTATFGPRVLVGTPDLSDRQLTEAWQVAATVPGTILVGTHRIVFWPVARLGLATIIQEGRRGMKDRQTPTVHAREILKTRARIERFGVVYLGRVPTTEVLGAGTEIVRAPGRNRIWPLVEVIDRREDPPGSGLLTDRVRSALQHALKRQERVFLFTHRHGYAPASRCVKCRTLRRCAHCGSRPDPGSTCARCGATLGPCIECGGPRFEPLGAGVGRVLEVAARLLGRQSVGGVHDNRTVVVGTERDLIGVGTVDLAVAVDADGLILGTNYRAAEEALRVLTRLAAIVPFGRGKRLMVQTSQPQHPVISALRRGDPLEFLEAELETRKDMGFPPAGELIVIEVREGGTESDTMIRAAVGDDATVYGPAPAPRGLRWLIQGDGLSPVRTRLRSTVQRLRDSGAAVRIDADPLDL
jgi:primosomal protein N' (replication factor Y)